MGLICEKADGGMRDALSLFDRVANFGAGRVMYQDVVSSLNVLDYEYYFRLVQLFTGDYKGVLLTLDELLSKGFDGALIVNGLASSFAICWWLRTRVQWRCRKSLVTYRTAEVAACCPTSFLFWAIRICVTCDQQYRQASNKRLQVELALMSISAMCSSSLKGSSESNVVAALRHVPLSSLLTLFLPWLRENLQSRVRPPRTNHRLCSRHPPFPPTPAAPVLQRPLLSATLRFFGVQSAAGSDTKDQ